MLFIWFQDADKTWWSFTQPKRLRRFDLPSAAQTDWGRTSLFKPVHQLQCLHGWHKNQGRQKDWMNVMNLTWFFIWPIRQYLTKMVMPWSFLDILNYMVMPKNIARHVTILMKLTPSFNMFKRGWGWPGRDLTTSLHLNVICRVQLGLWIFRPGITSPSGWNRFQPQIDLVQNRGTFFGLSYQKISGHNQVKNSFFRISNISVPCSHAQLKCRTVIKKLWAFFGPWDRDRSQSPPCWMFQAKQLHRSTVSERTTPLWHYVLLSVLSGEI